MKKTFILLLVVIGAGALALQGTAFHPHPPAAQDDKTRIISETFASAAPVPTGPTQKDAPNPSAPQGQQDLKTTPKPKTIGPARHPNLQYRALYEPADQPAGQWYPAAISAPQAWDITTGSQETTVAVIDSGFALEHDELFNRWAVNNNEIENNAIDDDNNGYVDDSRGWDFYHGDPTPSAGSDFPDGEAVSHGTSVAGLVGASGNNGLGVASINWQTRIMPLQVLDDDGIGYSLDVAAAIRYAVDNGADVINMSLGVDVPDPLIKAEIDYATAQNVLVVAASGNDGCDCLLYPANYPEVLSVGATMPNDTIAPFSSYGANLDVVAPGAGTIISPRWNKNNSTNDYTTNISGTSYAAPIASGLAALLKGSNASLTPAAISTYLKDNTDKVPAMHRPGEAARYGSGRINAYKSLQALGVAPVPPPAAATPLYRLYKSGVSDIYTTSQERRDELRAKGYTYEIIRF